MAKYVFSFRVPSDYASLGGGVEVGPVMEVAGS